MPTRRTIRRSAVLAELRGAVERTLLDAIARKAVLERSTSLAGKTAADEAYVLVMSYLTRPVPAPLIADPSHGRTTALFRDPPALSGISDVPAGHRARIATSHATQGE